MHLFNCIFPEIRQEDLLGEVCGEWEHGKEKMLLASLVVPKNAGFREIYFLLKKLVFHLLILLQPSIACVPHDFWADLRSHVHYHLLKTSPERP